ncbi:diacylglycerol kinase catalytic domain-containing protein [Mycoplasma mycoides]|uniref:NAD kinase n=1 Tax=Mycoplasma mycoides subsp. capri LC str. 95010 TaxID=862259 RepID=F4MPD5_MYCML|nr:NAD(+)/NADH kinase [Mycoplasma mycoides]QVJ96574.1 NAD(+)/NADH kinase [Mycoplasma mycoides subsp. capri]QVJ97462.1 NAD(+)/NADH kinase [Mycoplasma mycoides subsp. capri]QVK00455.1 NAD(+)/NADH kinase [Mycoplasma mycoides subsp. capri]QVK01341.1 NAD(+)/NADH kinase [Mycoplasma mycoides subsp. capri]QVK07110.1 NAD(+)/NADH kinase [Mycoplasma mycoides subsp. capri]
MKYSFITNKYEESSDIVDELLNILKSTDFKKDQNNPDICFVIGGDGTFLYAVHKYQSILDKLIFIPIKFGGIGFYTNKNRVDDLKKIDLNKIIEQPNITELGLIEVNYDDQKVYAINEIKITNQVRPLNLDIYINNEFLEQFKGTGLVFSTPSGSTGFMKSANGAIIYPVVSLFEMQELMPISTNKFRTLNAPIIFSDNEHITLKLEDLNNVTLSADTYEYQFKNKELLIKLSRKKIKLLNLNKDKFNKIKILRDIFVLNDKTKN